MLQRMRAIRPVFQCLAGLPTALLLYIAGMGQAQAGVEACWDLVNSFKPNDVSLAYQFVKEHGECIANFEDPAFQAVAGSLTSLTLTGVLNPGQCSSILANKNSQAAQQILSVADAGVINNYLNCGCAVADSGVAQKIKDLVSDVVSCAKAFDPTGPIFTGMDKAGDALGLSTLWGLAGSDHDPRAGVGNGGAPTENYDVATCTVTGIPIAGWVKAWDGSALPVGQHVRSCNCPGATRPYAGDRFVDTAPYTFPTPTFMCLVCPPWTAKDKYGNCSQCLNKMGPNGFEMWGANHDGSACALVSVEPTIPDPGKAIMDAAAAAGCQNNGTAATIRCGRYETHAACVKALPENADMCHLDQIAAVYGNAQLIWESVTTADAPCLVGGKFAYNKIRCIHPLQNVHCTTAKTALGDAWGPDAVEGITCDLIDDPAYNQLKEQAVQVLAAVNADYPAPGLQLQSLAQVRAAPPPAPCGLARHDPLVISCAEGFQMEAIPERASAVYAAINANNQGGRPRTIYCLADVDNDGAETPCLEGGPAPELPPPVMRLQVEPVPQTDGGGG